MFWNPSSPTRQPNCLCSSTSTSRISYWCCRMYVSSFSHCARTHANQSGALRYHVAITYCFVGVLNIVPKLHTVPHLCIKKSPCHHQNDIPGNFSDVSLLCQHEIKAASETKGGRNHSVPIHFKGCKRPSQVSSSVFYYWRLIRTDATQRPFVYLSWKQ